MICDTLAYAPKQPPPPHTPISPDIRHLSFFCFTSFIFFDRYRIFACGTNRNDRWTFCHTLGHLLWEEKEKKKRGAAQGRATSLSSTRSDHRRVQLTQKTKKKKTEIIRVIVTDPFKWELKYPGSVFDHHRTPFGKRLNVTERGELCDVNDVRSCLYITCVLLLRFLQSANNHSFVFLSAVVVLFVNRPTGHWACHPREKA